MTENQVDFTVHRSGHGTWDPAPNASVATRILFRDASDRASTRLVRLAAGHALPPALLSGTRTLYVVAGVVHSAAGTLEQGDFVEEGRGLQEWRARLPSTLIECSDASSGDAMLSLVSANHSVWQLTASGVRTSTLSLAPRIGAKFQAIRAEPDGVIPSSGEDGVEELFILQGSCLVTGENLEAGDYHRTATRATRPDARVGPEGCTMFRAVRGFSGTT